MTRPDVEEPAARVGTTLAGKYKLLRLLGAGGMGAVYEAEHARTGRRVAVKLMLGEHARDGELAARFLREARAAARIEHPNVVQVLDSDEAPDGTLFIIQEFLTGHDLRRLLDERRALPPREALEIIVPVMSALVAAHRAGVLHRDLKPENIFLARGASGAITPKLIDFGISKLADGDAPVPTMTRTGAAMGTPYYMSPEQARGERTIDAQADVWSIGVVVFEMLAGQTPFVGDSYNALLAQILLAPVPRVDALNPRVPTALADVIARALERDRAARYKTIANLLGALLDCQDVGDDAWRSTLKRTHRAAAGESDGLDDEPTIARAPAWGAEVPGAGAPPAGPVVTTLGRSAREIATPVPTSLRGVRALVGVGVAALLAAVAVAAWHPWSARHANPSAPRSAVASSPAPVTGPAMAPSAPLPSSFVVSVLARPVNATIDVDGAPTHANQFARSFARDGAAHRLTVSAPGYEPTTVEFVDAPPPSPVIELVPRRAGGAARLARVPRGTPGRAADGAGTASAVSAGPAQGTPPPNAPPPVARGANNAPIPSL